MSTNPLWAEFMTSMQKMGCLHKAMRWDDLSKGEFMVLAVIDHKMKNEPDEQKKAQGISVSTLTKLMQSSQPAVSRLLKGMEEKHYILRTTDTKDRRNIYVTVTSCGNEKRENAYASLGRISDRVVNRLGNEKMRELISLWDELAEYMQEEIEREKENQNETDI